MSTREFNYELYFEISPDLLCLAGFDGYFKKVNRAVSNLLGYNMEELYSRPINSFVHASDQKVTETVREQLRNSVPLINFENRYLTKSGEIVWLSWTSLPVESEQLIFAIAKDITHKKKQEMERNRLLANLTEINQELKQISYTRSHDLRSPVNNLMATLKLMDVSRINDQETLELIEIFQLASEQLQQTVNGYVDDLTEKHLDYADIAELSLSQNLNEVLQCIYSLIQSSNATIRADFSQLDKINFNQSFLQSIFLNLITNSIKYARPGYEPVISIFTSRENGRSQLTLSDNGIGFDMDAVKDRIFGLLQKFHDHTDSKGIGLYLVHMHVTSLGGKIEVESKVNEGTKFVITFKD